MERLGLIVADNDEDYILSLEKYLILKYPQRFDIFSFSSVEKLSEFLSITDNKEIMLINSKMLDGCLDISRIDTVVLLSENDDESEMMMQSVERVSKYQHTDKLVTDMLRIYASKTPNKHNVTGGRNTSIICIYSPAGGTGKTSIAAGCSILCGRLGLKTFYLNLENVPSTKMYFQGTAEQSFSNVIFHLKDNDSNLGIKLEGAKSYDSRYGIHFFAEADSILELEELTSSDIGLLTEQLKRSNIYDVVFVDMSCGLNQRNVSALGVADSIVAVLAADKTSQVKMNKLLEGFKGLEKRNGLKLCEKTITVLNKCDTIEMTSFSHDNASIQIGMCETLGANGNETGLVRDTAFLSRLRNLLALILPKEAAGQR